MSNWGTNYHRRELERESGRRWIPTPAGSSSSNALFAALEQARNERNQIARYERILLRLWMLAVVLFVAGIVVAAWSSINGFDAGVAAAALIAPGAVVAPCGFGGALALRLNLLMRLDRDVADIEQAYNTALLEAAK